MPSIVPEPSVPELSLAEINECKFGLVGEGRANVVFEVFAEPGSECSNVFQGGTMPIQSRIPDSPSDNPPSRSIATGSKGRDKDTQLLRTTRILGNDR